MVHLAIWPQPTFGADLAVDFEWHSAETGPVVEMPFTVGWTFTALNNASVTALGIWDIVMFGGNRTSHRVGLWAENGTLLSSQLVTTTTPIYTSAHGATFRLEPIPAVTLTAGETYRIGAEYTGSTYLDTDVFATSLSAGPFVNSNIALGSMAKGAPNSGFVFPSTLITGPEVYFGPDLMLTLVPEPSGFALVALSATTLLISRRRK